MRVIPVFCTAVFIVLTWNVSPAEARSRAVAREFQHLHRCPATGQISGACPGYVRDHIEPLACGGPDAVANLQWQTEAAPVWWTVVGLGDYGSACIISS